MGPPSFPVGAPWGPKGLSLVHHRRLYQHCCLSKLQASSESSPWLSMARLSYSTMSKLNGLAGTLEQTKRLYSGLSCLICLLFIQSTSGTWSPPTAVCFIRMHNALRRNQKMIESPSGGKTGYESITHSTLADHKKEGRIKLGA